MADNLAIHVGAEQHTAGQDQPHRSIGFLIAISLYWFAINFAYIAPAVLLFPSQVLQLLFREAPGATILARATWANDHAGIVLALTNAPGAIVALLANPYFGLLSDRTRARWGRRRPYIFWGSLVYAIALVAVAILPSAFTPHGGGVVLGLGLILLVVIQVIMSLASTAAAAPFHALLPDLVPQRQRGVASGVMGLAFWLGLVAGSIMPTFFGFNSAALLSGAQSDAVYQRGIVLSYVVLAVVVLLMAILTVVWVHETPWRPPASVANTPAHPTTRILIVTLLAVVLVPSALAGLIALLPNGRSVAFSDTTLSALTLVGGIVATIGAMRAFQFRLRENASFSWVVITRLLVVLGTFIVQNFLVLYMQNRVHTADPQAAAGYFVILLTLAATISTSVGGWASDRIGRKNMVYLSSWTMTAVACAFVVTPYLIGGSLLTVTYVLGAFFGLGYGVYVSVDWALVADVLPNAATFARDMGIWSLALNLPGVLATVIGGWLLLLGVTLGAPDIGYTFLFGAAAICCFLGTVTVRYITIGRPSRSGVVSGARASVGSAAAPSGTSSGMP